MKPILLILASVCSLVGQTSPVVGSILPADGAAGVPLESAGIHVDAGLRPVGSGGEVAIENLRVVGSALAGMRYLSERCGDGVAVASAWHAARALAGAAQPEEVATP